MSPWYGTVDHLLQRGDPEYRSETVAAHLICNLLREAVDHDGFTTYIRGRAFKRLHSRTFGTTAITMRKRALKALVRGLVRANHEGGQET